MKKDSKEDKQTSHFVTVTNLSSHWVVNDSGELEKVIHATIKEKEGSTDVVFFYPGYVLNDEELEGEYIRRKFKPVDPSLLERFNQAIRSFADSVPNATHWKNEKDSWCSIFFDNYMGRLAVLRSIPVDTYSSEMWFAGVPT